VAKTTCGFFQTKLGCISRCEAAIDGYGVAVRDHKGVLLASFCATKEFIIDPGTTKVLAAWKAVELSHHLGLRKIVLEGDSLKVVNDLKQESVQLGWYGHAMQDARMMLEQLLEWKVSHVNHQDNEVAHRLAKLALSLPQESLWMDFHPICVCEVVLSKLINEKKNPLFYLFFFF
jgi:ribonuclease HI